MSGTRKPNNVVLRPDDLTHDHTLSQPTVVVTEELKQLRRRVITASLGATLFAYVIGLVMPQVWWGIAIGLAVTLVVWWLFTFVWQGTLVRVQETGASLAARGSVGGM